MDEAVRRCGGWWWGDDDGEDEALLYRSLAGPLRAAELGGKLPLHYDDEMVIIIVISVW